MSVRKFRRAAEKLEQEAASFDQEADRLEAEAAETKKLEKEDSK